MRTYDKTSQKLIRAVCNCCGKELCVKHGALMEGACSVETRWGYFSAKDMERHSFDLCESCYDRLTASFAVPPEVTEITEI